MPKAIAESSLPVAVAVLSVGAFATAFVTTGIEKCVVAEATAISPASDGFVSVDVMLTSNEKIPLTWSGGIAVTEASTARMAVSVPVIS